MKTVDRGETPLAAQWARLDGARADAIGKLLLSYGLLSAEITAESGAGLPVGTCSAQPIPGIQMAPEMERDRQFAVQRVIMPALWCAGLVSVHITLTQYELGAYVDMFNYVATGTATESRFLRQPPRDKSAAQSAPAVGISGTTPEHPPEPGQTTDQLPAEDRVSPSVPTPDNPLALGTPDAQ